MAKKKTAQSEALELLHAAMAEAFRGQVELIKTAAASGEEVKGAAAILNVVRQFLKDNHIEAEPTPGTPMGNLIDDLPFDTAEADPAPRSHH